MHHFGREELRMATRMAKKKKALDSKIAEIEKPLGKRFTIVIVPSLISTVEQQITDPTRMAHHEVLL